MGILFLLTLIVQTIIVPAVEVNYLTGNDSTLRGKVLLLRARKYKGLPSRVAAQMGVTRSAVSRVFSGKSRSRRIEKALIAEMRRIERSLESLKSENAA